jgi:hypothetical protein
MSVRNYLHIKILKRQVFRGNPCPAAESLENGAEYIHFSFSRGRDVVGFSGQSTTPGGMDWIVARLNDGTFASPGVKHDSLAIFPTVKTGGR